jgi:hypothetical protein
MGARSGSLATVSDCFPAPIASGREIAAITADRCLACGRLTSAAALPGWGKAG